MITAMALHQVMAQTDLSCSQSHLGGLPAVEGGQLGQGLLETIGQVVGLLLLYGFLWVKEQVYANQLKDNTAAIHTAHSEPRPRASVQ